MVRYLNIVILVCLLAVIQPQPSLQAQEVSKKNLLLADPTIFFYEGVYYLYGTLNDSRVGGFKVYTSADQKTWEDKGYVLKMGESYGTKGFWAPQVFAYNGQFYMAYTASEHIAIAKADSPLGPFRQVNKKPLDSSVRMIDPFVYFDPSGKIYLYHVRVQKGNRIFVAELNKALTTIDNSTLTECINASLPWEDTQSAPWKVAEGPTILKHKGLYYMIYSANDFRNPDYAIGYATAAKPEGPWIKSDSNPIVDRHNIGINGTGHGDVVTDKKGKMWYVFHVHFSNARVAPRRTAIVELKFKKIKDKPDELVMLPGTFRLLTE